MVSQERSEPAPRQENRLPDTSARRSPCNSNPDPCQEARMIFENMVEALSDALALDEHSRARGRRAIAALRSGKAA